MNSQPLFINPYVFGGAAVALLLVSEGGCINGPELHTGLDSEPGADSEEVKSDTGEISYDDVKGLPVCKWGWVRLPPSQDEFGVEFDFYFYADVHQLVYGDADWSDAPATLYPVVYRTVAASSTDEQYPVGWEVYGTVNDEGYFWEVTYAMFNGWTESTQPFTLACASPAP